MNKETSKKNISLKHIVFALALLMPVAYLFYANFIREIPRALPQRSVENAGVSNQNNTSQANAVEAAEKVAETKSDYKSFLDLGMAYYNAGMYEKSVEAFKKAIEKDSSKALAYNNLAATYGELEQWELEIIACEKALQIDPNFQLAKNNLAWAKSELEKSKKAQ